jgi:hypothetical protein
MTTAPAHLETTAADRGIRTFAALPLPLGPAVHHPLSSDDENGLAELLEFAADIGARVAYHQDLDDGGHVIVVMAGAVAHVTFAPPRDDAHSLISQMQFGILHDDEDGDADEPGGYQPMKHGPIDAEDMAAFADADHDTLNMDWPLLERWRTYAKTPEIRPYTETLVRDPRYSPAGRANLDPDTLTEILGTSDPAIHAAAYEDSWSAYDRKVRPAYVKAAREHLATMVASPKFRWDVATVSYGHRYINDLAAALGITLEPRVLDEFPTVLGAWMESNPKHTPFVAPTVERIWDSLTVAERDAIGFDSRTAQTTARLAHLLPPDELPTTTEVLVSEIRQLAAETQPKREARYATAARYLIGRGLTKAAISRALGLTTNRIDRITSIHPTDVMLDSDDPLHTAIAQADA